VKYYNSKCTFAILVAAVMLTASAWAADNSSAASKGSMELDRPAKVAGTVLPAGKYRVEWTGTGDQVEVKILRGKNVVATSPAQMVKVDVTSYDHTSSSASADGTRALTQISFGKQKFALRLGNTPAETQRAAQ